MLVAEPAAAAPRGRRAGSSRSPQSAERAAPQLGRRVLRLSREILLVIIAFQAYRLVRLLTEGDRAVAERHGTLILRWEQHVGLAWERSVQSVVLRHDALLDTCNAWYTWAFWPTVAGTMLALYLWWPTLYRRYRNAVFLSGALGLAVFATFPVAPPRMLVGFVDTVHVFSGSGGLAHPTSFTNDYAAMPSFHVGWLVLAGVATMPVIRRRALRPLLLAPAAVMFVVVMATANHYLLDGVAGAVVALLGLLGADGLAAFNLRLPDLGRWAQDAAVAMVGLVSCQAAFAYQEAIGRGGLAPRGGRRGCGAEWSVAPAAASEAVLSGRSLPSRR
jgi:PAP2 superfamily